MSTERELALLRELEQGVRLERKNDHVFAEKGEYFRGVDMQSSALAQLDALRKSREDSTHD